MRQSFVSLVFGRAPVGPTCLVALTALLVAAIPATATAQDDPLGAIEAAADRGDRAAALEALDSYAASLDGEPDAARRARLSYLRGRLTTDPDSAEVAYLRAAIEGEGRYAGKARLRLAQLQLARGNAPRAAEHLARLRADDPGSDLVPESWVWTARAAEAAGDASTACAAWSEALAGLGPSHPARAEADQSRSRCEEPARQPGEVDTFTVQLGAFGSEDAAIRLRDGAAMTGVAVRVESPSGGVRVYRVRAGRFGSREAAEDLARRFRDQDFEAVVVPEEP